MYLGSLAPPLTCYVILVKSLILPVTRSPLVRTTLLATSPPCRLLWL